jgi:transposase
MFFDESRFGTHSKVGHGWFERGIRSTIRTKVGYKNFYLYSGVDVSSGENFNLILPYVNTDNMNVFLSNLSKEYASDIMVLIMDGAGWHKSKELSIPDNIKIIYLPPYSPELNPVERLWLYIKNNILANKLYETIDVLESTLCSFIQQLPNQLVKTICNINYLSF